jgi:hypothetical protein
MPCKMAATPSWAGLMHVTSSRFKLFTTAITLSVVNLPMLVQTRNSCCDATLQLQQGTQRFAGQPASNQLD